MQHGALQLALFQHKTRYYLHHLFAGISHRLRESTTEHATALEAAAIRWYYRCIEVRFPSTVEVEISIANTNQVFVWTISILASPDYLPRTMRQPSLSSPSKMQQDTAQHSTQPHTDSIQDFFRRYPARGSESKILSTKLYTHLKSRSFPRRRSAPKTRPAHGNFREEVRQRME